MKCWGCFDCRHSRVSVEESGRRFCRCCVSATRDERVRSAKDVLRAAVVEDLDRGLALQTRICTEHPRPDGLAAHAMLEHVDDGVEVDELLEGIVARLTLGTGIAPNRLRVAITDSERNELLAQDGLQLGRERRGLELRSAPVSCFEYLLDRQVRSSPFVPRSGRDGT
jgi:hypothetical protein